MSEIVLLATRNQGKVAEMRSIFASSFKDKYQVESLDFLGYELDDVEETGETFEENALLKARYVSEKTGYIALADDSGLEIEALNNAPGLYSARYATLRNDLQILASEGNQDYHNILQVLKDLQNFETDDERKARFRCCLAMVFPETSNQSIEQKEIIANGYWEGIITKEIVGENGFGYDPIFFDKNLGKTSAELKKEEKMKISHRAKAIENLLTQLQA